MTDNIDKLIEQSSVLSERAAYMQMFETKEWIVKAAQALRELQTLAADRLGDKLIAEAERDNKQARIEVLEGDKRGLVHRMKIFARDEVWRLNGICDPNGSRFTGQQMAQEALQEQDT